jgi:hypothetical protein
MFVVATQALTASYAACSPYPRYDYSVDTFLSQCLLLSYPLLSSCISSIQRSEGRRFPLKSETCVAMGLPARGATSYEHHVADSWDFFGLVYDDDDEWQMFCWQRVLRQPSEKPRASPQQHRNPALQVHKQTDSIKRYISLKKTWYHDERKR